MRDRPYPLMLFAAGFGTRMRPLTADRPKPLVQVAGRALIDHALDLAKGVAEPVVANAHYLAPMVEAHLAPQEVTVIVEDPDILDTGGGLKNARSALGQGPVLTLNTDAVWTGANPLSALGHAFDPTEMDGLLMLVRPDQAAGHLGPGDFDRDAAGRLTRGTSFVYSGAQLLKTDDLDAFDAPAFSLNAVWDRMIARGRLYGIVHDGGWCDVGRPESIAVAETLLAQADV